jgi:small-conductance mechanosensitive channel
MSETTITITVAGENAAEAVQRIAEQFPAEEMVVSGPPVSDGPEMLLGKAVEASAALPRQVSEWATGFVDDSGLGIFTALLISLAIIAIAWGADRLLAGVILSRRGASSVRQEDGLARTAAALRFGGVTVLRLLVFYALVRVGISLAFKPLSEAAELALMLLGTAVFVRAWQAIIEMLAAPQAPERRPTGLTDTEAAFISRMVMLMLVVLVFVTIAREFVISVVDAGESAALFAIVTRIIGGLAIAVLFFVIRKPVGRLIVLGFARDPAAPGNLVRGVARFWPAIYIVLQLLQIVIEARGYLEGTLGEDAAAIKRSFGALVLAPFVVAGIREFGTFLLRGSEARLAGRIRGLVTLVEGSVIVGTGMFILYAWNIDPFATDLTGARRILPGLVSAAIITVVGISLWRMASAFLDPVTAPAGEGVDEIPDGEGGKSGSRIETVLPVLRAVLAALIGTVTVLLALSALGVEIAPLLAGAGILGLAIGFGAQKVVEDVISGVLYLIEDAFRKGEYIETRQGKGIVEAIMLRSVRLRHHRGPVFTIPFSAMGTIQNHSRDWVTVKLSFEVSADQDLEKVRKLVKKVGADLLDDPELEGQFLAPLKSQGAVDMIGSNYKIGVKFTSEPGKQFLIRRKALNAIQKAFKENGIEMAAPRVIVDTHEQAAAAAAKAVSDAQAQTV